MKTLYNLQKATIVSLLSLVVALSLSDMVNAQNTILTQWNFNGTSTSTVPGGTSSPSPSIGSGTANIVGGTSASFASGTSNGGSSDPVTASPPNYGWNITNFPAATTNNKTAGAKFAVSTLGKQNIVINYDLRHSNTASRYEQFQYSTDGTNFIDFGAPFDGNAGDTWFKNRTIDLSAITAVSNNPNFAFRIVSTFAPPSNTTYVASSSSGTYATSGTWRFDMVTVSEKAAAPAQSITLSASSNSNSEAASTAITLTVTAAAPVSGNQTVDIAVSGSGISAADYTLSPTTITILNGQTTGTATFTAINDAEFEGIETATITLANPSTGLVLGSPISQLITIADNTCQPLMRKSTTTSTNGAEISAFDPISSKIYTVAGTVVEYYTLSNTGTLTGPTSLSLGFTPTTGITAVPNSVAILGGVVAVAYAMVNNTTSAQEPGVVAFYSASTGSYIHHVTVGYLPDMIIFSPNGTKVLTANEGEPNSYGQTDSFDPEGSISIIDISGGIASATVQTANFMSFNSQENALKAAGVRIYGPGATVAQDLEPEYITFSSDGSKALVTLQENNAIAEVDIATATVIQIIPLGLKNHNSPGNGIDASDRDLAPAYSSGTINIQTWPIFGMYQPDAITSFSIGGNNYYITANEGDSRSYTGYSEEIRVGASGYVLDATTFPTASTLKLNQNLGRLQLSNATGDTDNDGDFDQIHALGARSFTIWSSTFNQVFDSGDQLEQITAQKSPATFNSDGIAASFDGRSDNKGPEAEAVTTGMVNGKLYAFIGSERTGDLFVYDISNPTSPTFLQYIDNPNDLAIEGLLFVPAAESPTGKALIIASAEVSKTITVYEFSLVNPLLVSTNATQSTSQSNLTTYGSCDGLIANVMQSGSSPISGLVNTFVWLEPTQPANFVKRHYQITPQNNTNTATGTITLYFTQSEFDDFNAVNTVKLPQSPSDGSGKANLLLEKISGTSSNGTGLPNTYTGAVETINPDDSKIVWNTVDNRWEITFDVTGFSGFFVKTITSTLPVNWITFSAVLNNQKHPVLAWKVEETNTLKFEIEKSDNGIQFTRIGEMASKGNGLNNYEFVHNSTLLNSTFFRIKQWSVNGTLSYSPIIKINSSVQDLITVFPIPARQNVVVSIPNKLLNSTLNIFDVQGKLLKTVRITTTSLQLNLDELNPGKNILVFEGGITKAIIKE